MARATRVLTVPPCRRQSAGLSAVSDVQGLRSSVYLWGHSAHGSAPRPTCRAVGMLLVSWPRAASSKPITNYPACVCSSSPTLGEKEGRAAQHYSCCHCL